MNAFTNALSPSGSNKAGPKDLIIQKLQQEAAVTNARQLMDNINDNCFGKCVPKPGSTLSAGEETCMTQCMEKYMAAWNTIGKEYTNRIQREQANGWMLGGS